MTPAFYLPATLCTGWHSAVPVALPKKADGLLGAILNKKFKQFAGMSSFVFHRSLSENSTPSILLGTRESEP